MQATQTETFQFHLVRLKEIMSGQLKGQQIFQFHLVRLKVDLFVAR